MQEHSEILTTPSLEKMSRTIDVVVTLQPDGTAYLAEQTWSALDDLVKKLDEGLSIKIIKEKTDSVVNVRITVKYIADKDPEYPVDKVLLSISDIDDSGQKKIGQIDLSIYTVEGEKVGRSLQLNYLKGEKETYQNQGIMRVARGLCVAYLYQKGIRSLHTEVANQNQEMLAVANKTVIFEGVSLKRAQHPEPIAGTNASRHKYQITRQES